MFAVLLLGFSLTPLGLFLVFWSMFPQDRGIHPIYRESRVETLDETTAMQDAIVQRQTRKVQHEGKVT